MIQDARVLQTEFVPGDVQYRDSQVTQLSEALEPITRDEPPETAFLFGPSGAGKTCIARYSLTALREDVLDVTTQYVNCWENYSAFRTLYRILDGIGRTLDVHRQSTPTDELLERLRGYDGQRYVVVLDEVDQLADTEILYDLHRIPRISLILIANRERELFGTVDERVASRLQSSTRIPFDAYDLDQLMAILRERARLGLHEGVIERAELEQIADAAAGDARVAIGILRTAAREARREDRDRITADVVEQAIPAAREEVRRKDVESLTPDQQVLYDIIEDSGDVEPGELYDSYCERVVDPKTKRTVRNYLQKMRHYNLIEASGENRGRTYRLRTEG